MAYRRLQSRPPRPGYANFRQRVPQHLIAFAGGGGTLQIDGTATPSATISGFALGDVIDLADLAFSGGTAATLTSAGVLVVTEGATTRMVQLDPAHNYASQSFALSADAGSGTDVRALVPLFVSSACFVPTSGPLRAGQSITITLHLNEHPVTVAGAPKLSRHDSRTAGCCLPPSRVCCRQGPLWHCRLRPRCR
jgi:hypothetical protein